LDVQVLDLVFFDVAKDVFAQFGVVHLGIVFEQLQRVVVDGQVGEKAPADDESVGLTSHLTGCMLMEAMCVLKHR
jgi:hypothetical protein